MSIEPHTAGDMEGSGSIQAEDKQARVKKMTLEMMKEGRIWELLCRKKVMGIMKPQMWGSKGLAEVKTKGVFLRRNIHIPYPQKEAFTKDFWFEGLKGP